MAYDESLAARVRKTLPRTKNIIEKKMFGGVGFLLNGNMCVGVWKEYLILRVGPDNYDEALAQPNVKEFDITGRAMKGWVMVAPEGMQSDGEMIDWIRLSIDFVRRLPPK
jgi:TfoX/Sxy family transcriptional regulator of competence genes